MPKDALKPYLQKTFANVLEESPGRFTGPWYREDKKTIFENKNSLKNSPFLNLYQNFEELSSFVEDYKNEINL